MLKSKFIKLIFFERKEVDFILVRLVFDRTPPLLSLYQYYVYYAYYACTSTMLVLCLYYVYYACTLPTMPIYNHPERSNYPSTSEEERLLVELIICEKKPAA